jgi:hypothetical protein
VTPRKRNESKSPLLMSKRAKTISKPWFVKRSRDKFPTKPDYGRNGIRHIGGLILGEATIQNVGTFGVDANGKATSGLNHKGERTDATPRDGAPRSSDEVRESGRSEGVHVVRPSSLGQPEMGGARRTRQNRIAFHDKKSWKPTKR